MARQTSAGVVIYREPVGGREYLLLKYPSGHWDFAKGKLEPGETLMQAAVREAREETGISDLSFVDGFEDEIRYDFSHNGERIHKRVVFYLARTRSEGVRISSEHRGYRWAGLGEALGAVTYDNARFVLSRADSMLSSGLV